MGKKHLSYVFPSLKIYNHISSLLISTCRHSCLSSVQDVCHVNLVQWPQRTRVFCQLTIRTSQLVTRKSQVPLLLAKSDFFFRATRVRNSQNNFPKSFCFHPRRLYTLSIERLHMTTEQPYWCSKSMKRQPYWCSKPILRELNLFLRKHFLLFQQILIDAGLIEKTLYFASKLYTY